MTRNAFVIGHPIAHSRSPLVHTHWLERLGINGTYEAFDVTPEALESFVARLRNHEFVGGNVTIPHKQTVLGLCDELSAEAEIIGAVNTLILKDDRILGHNTDMDGFLANLDDQAAGWDKNPGAALVLGAGGAARAILVGLERRGFRPIHILNRTPKKAKVLAGALDGPFEGHGLDAFSELAPQARLLINTSAVGMDGTGFDLDLQRLPDNALVTDIVYTPLKTKLLADAERIGLRTADGLGMLLHQAVPGFEAWFGQKPEVTAELRTLIEKSLGLH